MHKITATLGIPSGSPRWTLYENGKVIIPPYTALAICDRYGITLDWLYRGQWHAGMPFDLGEQIKLEEMRALERERPGINPKYFRRG